MFIKNHYFFYFLLFIILFTDKKSSTLDDSDILVDRVFMTAVKKKNYQKVEEMLDNDAAVNYKDSENLVALAYALDNDDRRMFELLVTNGADTKQMILNRSSLLIFYVSMNRQGMTALMHSIEKENVNAINILIKYKVDKEITDFSGKTIFDYSDLSRNLLIKRLIQSLDGVN